jgi:hypothetical protein
MFGVSYGKLDGTWLTCCVWLGWAKRNFPGWRGGSVIRG